MKKDMEKVLQTYSRPVTHMRAQVNLKRFGLVFGSGGSQAFGFPSWDELIKRIAKHEEVQGQRLLEGAGSKTAVSQLLFQKFKAKKLAELTINGDEYGKSSSLLQAGWHRILNEVLYRDVPKTFKDLLKKDPYLKEFLDIIKQTRLTVNYNFDDTLETFLGESRTKAEKEKTRGYRTVWNPDLQLYPEDAVIYHPNGYLSRDFTKRSSDTLIFLEDDFGDQLIESSSGHYAALAYHFSQNTCLFVGLSLDDSTLKHLLRRTSNLHPGHVHYYIHYLKDKDELSEEQKTAIRDANFEVYNLVTLFLSEMEISALGRLLRLENEEIDELADKVGVPTAFKFFLTGSVSVGKTTSVSNFRSLQTHDEWLDPIIPDMGKDPSLIDEKEVIKKIDKWVVDQWRFKTIVLSSSSSYGIHIVDRSPLDAFAFTPEEEWISKAKFTINRITPEKSKTQLVPGRLILLIGDPQVMALRATKLQKEVQAKKLQYRQELLKIVFDSKEMGVIQVDTREKSIGQVVKDICKIIHIDEYEEFDFQSRLKDILIGNIKGVAFKE